MLKSNNDLKTVGTRKPIDIRIQNDFEGEKQFLRDYLNLIKDYPVLNAKESKMLFDELAITTTQEEKSKIRSQLIEGNLRLVTNYIIRKYYHHKSSRYDLEDVIQVGNEILINAIDHYDSSKNSTFSTYLFACLRKLFCNQDLQDTTIQLRKGALEYSNLIKKGLFFDGENDEQLIKKLKIKPTKYQNIKTAISESISYEELMEKEAAMDDETIYTDPKLIITEKEGLKSEDIVNECKIAIKEALETLPTFEKQILKLRYGLDGEEQHKYREIEEKLNKNRGMIGSAERRTLRYLRQLKNIENLFDYYDERNENYGVPKMLKKK